MSSSGLFGLLGAIDLIEVRLGKQCQLAVDEVEDKSGDNGSMMFFTMKTRVLYLSMLGECYYKLYSQHQNAYAVVVLNEFQNRSLNSYTLAVQHALKHLSFSHDCK